MGPRSRPAPLDVLEQVRSHGPFSALLVAYSGGVDSHVLLHCLAGLRDAIGAPIGAIHVNHRLQPMADDWAAHCRSVCARLDVPLRVVDVAVDTGSNLEARARAARYAAWEEMLLPGEALCAAQHRDDQAETVLLRLLRGSGVDGLAAMPPSRALGAGRLLRPLLQVSRQQILAYAEEHDLDYVDDPSNHALSHDRNYLRHVVIPGIEQRWPDARATLARFADAAAESRRLGLDLAAADGLPDAPVLDCAVLWALPGRRRRNLLRAWLQRLSLRPPGRLRLEQGLHDLLHAEDDRQPELRWPGGRIRRYRESLYADDGVDPPPLSAARPWRGEPRLLLPSGILHARPVQGGGLRAALAREGLAVAGRVPGEVCRPVGGRRRAVKKLLQEAGIPPWQRDNWPRVRLHGELVAIPGICICEGFVAEPGQQGLELRYEPRS